MKSNKSYLRNLAQPKKSGQPREVVSKRVMCHCGFSNTSMQVQIRVPSKDIGKVKVGQKVVHKVEAYPYQNYGVFYGEVLQVDRIKTATGPDIDSYSARTTIDLPVTQREPASEVVLVDGLRIEGSIIFNEQKKSTS